MSALADHLWQSTWFAGVAWMLATLLHKDAARFRFWLWFAASLKFLVPFAALIWLGSHVVWLVDEEPTLLPFVKQAVEPLSAAAITVSALPSSAQSLLLCIWLGGSLVLALRWLQQWRHARALVRAGEWCGVYRSIPVLSSTSVAAPCAVGVRNPVILIPSGLNATLDSAHVHALLSHEAAHVRRRDTSTAALHAIVEIVFWFHPLVWWIGARLLASRELACDEETIEEGHPAATYAAAILSVCASSVKDEGAPIASAAGGDLNQRIRAIMAPTPPQRLRHARRGFALVATTVCVLLPVASGAKIIAAKLFTPTLGAESIRVSERGGPTFVAATDDYVYARNVSLRELIGHAYSTRPRDVLGEVAWLDSPRYDIELRPSERRAGARGELVAEFLERQFNLKLRVHQ